MRRKGFTLIGLIVAVLITMVLLLIVVKFIPSFKQAQKNSFTLKSVETAVMYAQGRAYSSGEEVKVKVHDKTIEVIEGTKVLKTFPASSEFKATYEVTVNRNGKIEDKDIFLKSSVAPNCIHVGEEIYYGKNTGGSCK